MGGAGTLGLWMAQRKSFSGKEFAEVASITDYRRHHAIGAGTGFAFQ
jgi:hypothetical protein